MTVAPTPTTLAATALLGVLPAQARVVASFEANNVIDQRVCDTDGDDVAELVLLHDDRLSRHRVDGAAWRADGEISVEDPAHTLVSLADILQPPGLDVVIVDRRSTVSRPWGDGPAVALARRGRFTLRVDRPQFSPFVVDLNEDGRLDLMIPGLSGVTPFFQERIGDDGVPDFVRLPRVKVPVSVDVDPGSRGIDQELGGSVSIPQIRVLDLNGDGRPDMLTKEGNVHSFHMQSEEGTFDEPIQVDLTKFVDSTPKGSVNFGRTAVLSDAQQLQRGDIDGDDVPDFVVAHRRKLWAFLGTDEGPQFREARTQAVAEDVTAMRMMDLNEDGRDDLLTFRVQVPDVASAVMGLVRSTDIDLRAVGYESEGDGFAKKPRWRRTITLRVPPLLSLLGRQEELIERFTKIVGDARISSRGAFLLPDGDDLVIVSKDATTAQLFPGIPRAPRLETADGIRLLRRLLFEDEDTVFDLERLFDLVSGFISRLSDQPGAGREPAATLALRDPDSWQLILMQEAAMDANEGDEMLIGYVSTADPRTFAYDVISWRP